MKVNHLQKILFLFLIQRTWLSPQAALLLVLQDRIKEPSGDAAIALIMEEKVPETLLMKAKPNIYLIFLLRRTLAKPASSLPTLDAG